MQPNIGAQGFQIKYRGKDAVFFNASHLRRTKIVCAIGPASQSKEVIGSLIDAGMNVARLNMSHGTHDFHATSVQNLREAIAERREQGWSDCSCANLMDTKGPEIRTGLLKGGVPLKLIEGQKIEILYDDTNTLRGDCNRIYCNYEHIASSATVGSIVLVADGSIVLKVLHSYPARRMIVVRSLTSNILGECKNMGFPGGTVRLPGITEEDRRDILEFALKYNVDIISGSFVRHPSHVQEIRQCLGSAGERIRVHAKLETVEALKNIESIVEIADGIHVSRGDLGMELPLEKVCLAQKMAIHIANLRGKTVVTSTQMLDSMKYRPRPSSAECTDIANAVIDGTDCVMLSGETASGMYPQKAVQTMSRIIIEAERCLDFRHIFTKSEQRYLFGAGPVQAAEALASSAVETATLLRAKLLSSLSYSGYLMRLVAKYPSESEDTSSDDISARCEAV